MEWDDYQLFMALAHRGSVRGAAETLGVNPSTVTRRLEALEQRLGVALFTRSSRGLALSAEAADVLARVEGVAEDLQAIERDLQGRNEQLSGVVRLAVPEVVAVSFLLDELSGFQQSYPDIELVLLPVDQALGDAGRGADVAIRATDDPPGAMIGRPLCRFSIAAYTHVHNLESSGGLDAAAINWVEWLSDSDVALRYRRLRDRYFPQARIHLRCDNVLIHQAALRAGSGVGLLPCLLGETDGDLARLPDMPVQSGPTLWLLTHADLRSARRVQVLMDYLRDVFERRADELLVGLNER